MLTDLRGVNAVIQPMGALQPGLPSPSMIPANWLLIILDLKDCFFTIPLHPEEREKFAFSVPVINNIAPRKHYQRKVLPQSMLNSPTLCQYYVASVVEPGQQPFPKCYIVHYMDDILCAAPSQEKLTEVFPCLQSCLKGAGLIIAPEKIPMKSPYQYLGTAVEHTTVHPQKVELKRDQTSTLKDLQKLLGDINLLRLCLRIPTNESTNICSLLRGDSKLNSPGSLTVEVEEELKKTESKIQNSQLCRVNLKHPIQLVIIPSPHSPMGILMQLENTLEWLYLPNNVTKIFVSVPGPDGTTYPKRSNSLCTNVWKS